jgi:hypothetical protein
LIDSGALAIVGAVHELASGTVEFFEDTWMCGQAALPAEAQATAATVPAGARDVPPRFPVLPVVPMVDPLPAMVAAARAASPRRLAARG